MSKHIPLFKRTAVCAAVAFAIGISSVQAATVVHKNTQRFSVYNLVASFNGWTFGKVGNGRYRAMLCDSGAVPGGDLTNLPLCDADHDPIAGVEAAVLYPIDSEFGFHVVPYALATQKELDGIYAEGWAGNIYEADKVIGVELSDAETDTFQVPAGLGTWCAGLGGTSVKCSTEHYTVMEHVLTCHETVAYVYTDDGTRADPDTGTQAILTYEEDGVPGSLDCTTTKLDNDLVIHADGETWDGKTISQAVADMEPIDPADPLSFLVPNESTVLTDIAVGDDYSITAKDDGKPLYRWGTLIKRPNDIRMYVRHPLPAAFKTGGACETLNGGLGCRITKAELHIVHNITNNPNDQLRPEDMENEGAFGRKPGYDITTTLGTESAESWVSDTDCYEGDGDFIPAGTVLKNAAMAAGSADYPVVGTDPYAWSADLKGGLSNGWYTSVDREPFEWAYDTDGDGAADVSYRKPTPTAGTLLSGPRWRLTPGKFGQDLPGLDVFDAEVAGADCAPPPYQKALIKYEVGTPTKTIINMLDWEADDERSVTDPSTSLPVSPMTFSSGWVDGTANDGTVLQDPLPKIHNPTLTGVTVNGAPVSEDFDLSVYVKGDRKPTQLYYSWMYIEYDDGTPE